MEQKFTQVKASDFVVVFSDKYKKKIIAKVIEIDSSDAVKLEIYALPSSLEFGRQPYHSRFELVRTDINIEEQRDSILKVVQVLRFQDYMKIAKQVKEESPLEEVTDENLDDFHTFFFRQRYSDTTKQCIPEPKVRCICRKELNPDEDFLTCPNPSCGEYMHVGCLRTAADRKCSECQAEFAPKEIFSGMK